jgi:hypothetical protein
MVITAETVHDPIPLTVGETRRLFNLHTRNTRPRKPTNDGPAGDAATKQSPGSHTTPAGSTDHGTLL